MSVSARIMTQGTPLVLDTPYDVYVMRPQFFNKFITDGKKMYSRLELDLSTSSGMSS